MAEPERTKQDAPHRQEMRRTLLMSALQPSTSIIMENLLRGMPDELHVVPRSDRRMWSRRLTFRGGWRLQGLVDLCAVPLQTWRLVKLMRRDKTEILFTLPAGVAPYCTSAYLAHRLAGGELFFMSMDDWETNVAMGSGFLWRRLTHWTMRGIAARATHLWAISPQMADDWRRQFGARPEIFWLSTAVGRPPPHMGILPDRTVRTVAVAASLYWYNIVSFRALQRAVDVLNDDGAAWKIRLYTLQSPDVLAKLAIHASPTLELTSTTPRELSSALANEDVLFFGLSFAKEHQRTVELAFPSKIPDYLASGRPILASAPPATAASVYLTEMEAALVVADEDPATFAAALRRLTTDAEAVEQLTTNAWRTAETNHDRDMVVPRFQQAFMRET